MRALRNLNPRYEADGWIPAGTTINATTRIAGLYNRYCVSGPRADLARTLITADVNAAIKRPTATSFTGSVAVGDVQAMQGGQVPPPVATPAPVPRPATPARRQARSYTVARGDTLGRIASRFQCEVPALARANGLRAPAYAIKPGQRLKLEGCDR
jgi:membrane-bound lytic murein transglycosylase D